MASAAVDDEDLALSMSSSHIRRNSARGPGDTTSNGSTAAKDFQAADTGSHRAGSQHKHSHHSQNPSTASSRTTHRLGQYEILKTLGEGSFGKVKLAVHMISGQKVALKIISRRKLMARDMQGRIEREIQYLQLLRHPHIIKLYTVITTATEIIMVLEYAGSELFNYIVEHGKMVEDKARQFFQQIVCAVEYCHRHKIVHRDLKPENLLLDDQLHVKIADFGLSNIMTDGNFLKTSCGSPNYAAPEVISGKLYAGPEVDVWSCGVILYVLLVGRLPFDDDYIPALFKKIAQGNYHVPHYLSPGAVRLIKKMLQVSPVNRITVQEIRQDPWFMKNLPDYLQPPVEEFVDTGVDPNKAINPRSLAPTKSPAVVERLHNQVVGKLGKTLGYGLEDVNQALAVDEPNAIKDAYLIVAENQMMKETASMNQNPSMQPFLAQSPPAFGVSSPIAKMAEGTLPKPSAFKNQESRAQIAAGSPERTKQSSITSSAGMNDARSPVSTIGVLPSSLPDYHQAYMKGQPKVPQSQQSDGQRSPGVSPPKTEQQAAGAAGRLKPHSRSQVNLDKAVKPESMTPAAQPTHKKTRMIKWQFGIRSRNQPAEAMLAIYKALQAMGAEWEVPTTRKPGGGSNTGSAPSEKDGTSDNEDMGSDDDESEQQQPDSQGDMGSRQRSSQAANLSSNNSSNHNSTNPSTDGSLSGSSPNLDRSGRNRSRYGSFNDWGYAVPQDPWIINARFRKDGMYPPGVPHPNSAHSSRVDLNAAGSDKGSDVGLADPRRRSSTMSSTGSSGSVASAGNQAAVGTNPGDPHVGPAPAAASASPAEKGSSEGSAQDTTSLGERISSRLNMQTLDDSAYVYMTIQLYSIEKEFYLVDFKCAGYERLIRKLSHAIVEENEDASLAEGDEDESPTETDAKAEEDAGEEGGKDWGSNQGSGSSSGLNIYQRRGKVVKEELQGDGRMAEEKDVSSPFPFLDVASRLIIQLAEAE